MGGKRYFLFKNWLFYCFITLILGISGPALAQDDEEEEFTLEEIIVTAEKREAELQNIPMDISVLRMDDMRQLNVNQIYDLEKVLPDISTDNNVGNFIIVSIREVTTGQWNPMFEQTVSTHLDGVQLTRFGGLENFFFDLDRVEVLKGPQGTLYGRGSTAGSMNMITKKPILGEFSGNGELEVGNYSLYRGDIAMNIPIIDNLAMRISGRRIKRDGYSDSGYNDANSLSGRISLLWEPTDLTTVTVVGDTVLVEDNGYAMATQEGWSGGPSGYYYNTYGGVQIVANDTASDMANWPPAPYNKAGPVESPWMSRWAVGNMLDTNWNDVEHNGGTIIVDHEFDFATLTAQFAHRSIFENKQMMWGGPQLVPYPYIIIAGFWGPTAFYTGTYPISQMTLRLMTPSIFTEPDSSSDTESYEVRLTSKTNIPAGDKFEWIIGAMYQDDKVTEDSPWYWVRVDTKSKGLFGQASWMPIDKWNITGGYRWNSDKKYYIGKYMWDIDYTTFQFVKDFSALERYKYHWSEPSYKLNLSYIPTNDIMTYLQYSKGYRTGNVGYDASGNHPEVLGAWELGFKSRWLDDRLQINTGTYFYNYRNYNEWTNVSVCRDNATPYLNATNQWECPDNYTPGATPQDPPVPGADGVHDDADEEMVGYLSISPGGAEQVGLTADIIWLITPNDTVTATGTWRKNEYKSPYSVKSAVLRMYPNAISALELDTDDEGGTEFGGAPIRGNIGYTHTAYFGTDVMTASVTIFYDGEGIDYHMNLNTPAYYVMPGRDEYWTVDLGVTYNSSRWLPEGMKWTLRSRVSNLFDDDAISFLYYYDDTDVANNAYGYAAGYMTGNYINPRTFSFSFGINF